MMIKVRIADESVALSDESLANLNKVLAQCPVLDAYNEDKVKEHKRIKLEAILVVKTRMFDVAE
jgi:hypothetical protein